MAPKVDIDMKLKELREYVESNDKQLAAKGKHVLKSFFSQCNPQERSFYFFLSHHEHSFTNAQRAHAEETLALLLHPAPNLSTQHEARKPLKRKTSSFPQNALSQSSSSSASGGAHPAVLKRACFSSASGNAHTADDALPALDESILQKIRELGHYPTEIKNPKTPDEKNEQRLAALFRRHTANSLSTTVAEVESLKNNAERVKEVKDKLEQLRRHRPSKDEALRSQELQRQLLLMLRNEPKAVLQKEKWNEDEKKRLVVKRWDC